MRGIYRQLIFGLLTALACVAQINASTDGWVACDGRVVAEPRVLRLHSTQPQAVVQQFTTKVGERVEAGEVLALIMGYDAARAALAVAESEAAYSAQLLIEALEESRFALNQTEHTIPSLEATLADAHSAHQRKRLSDPELEALQAQYDAAEARVRAHETMARLSGLEADAELKAAEAERDAMSREREREVADAHIVALQARTNRSLAEQEHSGEEQRHSLRTALANLKNGKRLNALPEAAASEVAAAKAALQKARDALAYYKLKIDALKTRQELQAKKSAAHLAQLETELETYRVRAPIAGELLAINTYPGEASGIMGIADFADRAKIYVEAQVYIHDIRKVRLGANVEITGDGFSEIFSGTVASITKQVEPANLFSPDANAFVDRRIVRVRIDLDAQAQTTLSNLLNTQVIVRIAP